MKAVVSTRTGRSVFRLVFVVHWHDPVVSSASFGMYRLSFSILSYVAYLNVVLIKEIMVGVLSETEAVTSAKPFETLVESQLVMIRCYGVGGSSYFLNGMEGIGLNETFQVTEYLLGTIFAQLTFSVNMALELREQRRFDVLNFTVKASVLHKGR